MQKARKIRPPKPDPQRNERRNLVRECALSYEHGFPEIRPDGLPRELVWPAERDGFEVRVMFQLNDEDEVVVDRLLIGDNRPVRGQRHATPSQLSRVLEGLPLARWRDEALRDWPKYAMRETAAGEFRSPAPEAVERARQRLGDGVEQAARVYREHDGHAPTRAVADQLGIEYQTARSRIKTARKRGLLPEAPGRGRRSRFGREA